jgi:flagellar basal-body rod protein FlgF
LQISPTGQLVTSDGDPVIGEAGPITFQPNDRQVSISRDGTISVREGKSKVDSQRGALRMVSFDNVQQLQKDGNGAFTTTGGAQPQPDKKSHVVQGAVEKSNVRGVVEMSRMIEITRSYTQVASLLQQQHDLNQSAIDKLAEVPN